MTTRSRQSGTLEPGRNEGLATSKPLVQTTTGIQGVPGPPGSTGPTGAQGIQGVTGPVGEGSGGLFFESRTGAAGATVGVDIKTIRTAGFAAVGDGGHGLYKRRATAPTLTANPGYFRSIDRFKADGTTDNTHGGYWELVPEGGVVRIEQFGGKADTTTGLDGTDNYQPIIDATAMDGWAFDANNKYALTTQFGFGQYRVSQMLDFARMVNLRGWTGATEVQGHGDGTMLVFPVNTTCMVFQSFGTGPGQTGTTGGLGVSGGSTVEGIAFKNVTLGTDRTKHGIHMRDSVTIRRCSFYNISGNAINIQGSNGGAGVEKGSPNGWRVENCYVYSCAGHGLYVRGSDANAGTCINLHTKGGGLAASDGCGIFENSSLGNNYFGFQIDGFGGKGVSHNDSGINNHYVLVTANPTSGASTTPGTNPNVWYNIGPGPIDSNFPLWSGAGTYTPQLPILVPDESGNRSVFVGGYVETQFPSHIPSGCIALGGQYSLTSRSSYLGSEAGNIFTGSGIRVSRGFRNGSAEYAIHGAAIESAIGEAPSNVDVNGFTILRHSSGTLGEFKIQSVGTATSDIVYSGPGDVNIWRLTTASTPNQMGTNAPKPYKIGFQYQAYIDTVGGSEWRIHSMQSGKPTSGEHAPGEISWNYNPQANGIAGYSCVALGTPGTWGSLPIFGLTSITPQANGDFVIENTSNTSVTLKYKGSDGVVRSVVLTLA